MALITISRGTFGGGRDVAQKLAEHLNYSCVSREMIIEDASRDFHIPRMQLLNSTAELPTKQHRKASAVNFDIRFIRASLLKRAIGNRMVFHGHGGHLLLGGIPGLLRVRIIAGMEYRINHAMNEEKIDREQAVDLVTAIDKKRILWSRQVWGVEWNDPSYYDLLLSLDNLSVDGAVKIITRATELDDFADNENIQQVLEDELIKSRVWAALTQNDHTRPVRIEVDSKEGDITVRGDVGSNKLVEAIVTIAQSVHGVKSVINNLSVGSSWHW
jgi:osmotically-inducible protein OsmY